MDFTSAVTPSPQPTATPALKGPQPRPALDKLFLGRVVDTSGPDDSQIRVITGAASVGPVKGWASLDQARTAVAQLTAGGAVPAAAIFQLGNRYVAQSLTKQSRGVEPGGNWSDWASGPLDFLEGTAAGTFAFHPYRTTPEAKTLQAVIDGDFEALVKVPK